MSYLKGLEVPSLGFWSVKGLALFLSLVSAYV